MKTLAIIASFIIGTLFSGIITKILDEEAQFIAILAVVFLDAVFGIARAISKKEFETKKAFKGVYMLVAFWLLLAVVLLIEMGYPFASFLSEAILLPIITFQIISILKNMHLLGLISGSLLDRILSNIDKHKEKAISGTSPEVRQIDTNEL